MTPGMLINLREKWATHISTDAAAWPSGPYFTVAPPAFTIPVFTEKLATLQQKITDGLLKTGLSVLIATVVAKKARNELPGFLAFEGIVAVAHVISTPNANPSQLAASDVAERIAWDTTKFKFNGAPMRLLDLSLSRVNSAPGRVAYDVIYTVDTKTAEMPTR